MFSLRVRSSLALFAALWLGLAATILPAPWPVSATSPCESASGDPGDPGIGSEPDVAGVVRDDSLDPISGASMGLYRCVSGAGQLVASSTTNNVGHYAFNVTTPGFYYVQASLVGPLAGMSPTGGTTNPSALITVGAGDLAVDFVFE